VSEVYCQFVVLKPQNEATRHSVLLILSVVVVPLM
jgi:hypothetical protein